MTHNRDLMAAARAKLRGHWGTAVLLELLFGVLVGVIGWVPFLGWIVDLAIVGTLQVGVCLFFLHLTRGQPVRVGQLFDGFPRFGQATVTYLLVTLFVVLWSLLLVIPGVIAAYSYALSLWIAADNPGLPATEALARSKALMKGRRWKLFCLSCRFIGWALLCLLTAGIAFLWLWAYITTSVAEFYHDAVREGPVSAAPQPPPLAQPPSGAPA